MGDVFITNDVIQAAVIAWLKTRPLITAEVVSAEEIKEDQWGGAVFAYPGIRVRLISNNPTGHQGCPQDCTVGIQVYTEDASSINADRIAGIIAKEIHDNSFIQSSIQFGVQVTNLVPAYHRDAQTWMAEVLLDATIA
jgi:hypothetical protein